MVRVHSIQRMNEETGLLRALTRPRNDVCAYPSTVIWKTVFFFIVMLCSFSIQAEYPRFETEIILSPPNYHGVDIQTFQIGNMGIQRVKVTPIWGRPYYLIPSRGEQFFDNSGQSFSFTPVMHVAEWVLWEW